MSKAADGEVAAPHDAAVLHTQEGLVGVRNRNRARERHERRNEHAPRHGLHSHSIVAGGLLVMS